MRLSLDHLILRVADPAAAVAELHERAGMPVLAAPERVGGLQSALVRAGSVDVEALAIGADPPPRALGYGLGFTADVPLEDAVRTLRTRGLPTAPAATGSAGAGAARRTWRAVHVQGLLPGPFPVPATTRAPGAADRALEALGSVMGRIGPVARAVTRRPGGSMVVLTEYGFDVGAWRAAAGEGPAVLSVEVGIDAGQRAAWAALPLTGVPEIVLHEGAPAGVRAVLLRGERDPFALGDVQFSFAGGPA
jgi:hypothetical protein